MNPFFQLIYFFKRKITPGFQIGKDKLVLDVGSGDRPFWRADVFLDNLYLDNNQRISGQNTVNNVGLFVNADATNMPFKNKVFDFSFCSHLLEHVKDPASVIDEIVRVSKQGYIEIPNGITEAIRPFHSHLWFIYYAYGKLFFVRKSKQMHKLLLQNGLSYDYLIKNMSNPFMGIYWQRNIRYQIINNPSSTEDYKSGKELLRGWKKTGISGYLIIIKLMRFLFYKPKIIKNELIFKK